MNYCVVPLHDLYPHDEYSERCTCVPVIEEFENGAKLYVHNAFDEREKDEQTVARLMEQNNKIRLWEKRENANGGKNGETSGILRSDTGRDRAGVHDD